MISIYEIFISISLWTYSEQKLEGTDGLFSWQKVLRDDSLEGRDSTADNKQNNTESSSIYIASTHKHRSHNNWNQRQVDTQRLDCSVNDELKNASKHRHGATEHLSIRISIHYYLVQSKWVILQRWVRQNDIDDKNDANKN